MIDDTSCGATVYLRPFLEVERWVRFWGEEEDDGVGRTIFGYNSVNRE